MDHAVAWMGSIRVVSPTQIAMALLHQTHKARLILLIDQLLQTTNRLAERIQWRQAVIVERLNLKVQMRVLTGHAFGDGHLRVEGRAGQP